MTHNLAAMLSLRADLVMFEERHDQEDFWTNQYGIPSKQYLCETAFCAAGWVGYRNGLTPSNNSARTVWMDHWTGEPVVVSEFAKNKLGITHAEAWIEPGLFLGGNTHEETLAILDNWILELMPAEEQLARALVLIDNSRVVSDDQWHKMFDALMTYSEGAGIDQRVVSDMVRKLYEPVSA